MKFSYIIPIYKVEQYLNQCVESILVQTYKDFEIILVDDGSPDNCPALCDKWVKQDKRISVIHKKNGGLSDARNCGLVKASGDYVIFVDSDDFWDNKDGLEHIAQRLENSSIDLLFFNIFYYDNNTGVKFFWPSYAQNSGFCTSTQALQTMLQAGTVPMSAWCKVIKKSILLDNNLSFQSGIYGEDIPWFISLMQYSNRIAFLDDYIYAYRQNVSSSITRSNRPKHIHDMRYIIESECKNMKTREVVDTWKNLMYSFIAYNYCILLSQYDYVSGDEREELWAFLNGYKFLLSYSTHAKVRKVHKLARVLGIKPTAYILKYYLNHR